MWPLVLFFSGIYSRQIHYFRISPCCVAYLVIFIIILKELSLSVYYALCETSCERVWGYVDVCERTGENECELVEDDSVVWRASMNHCPFCEFQHSNNSSLFLWRFCYFCHSHTHTHAQEVFGAAAALLFRPLFDGGLPLWTHLRWLGTE